MEQIPAHVVSWYAEYKDLLLIASGFLPPVIVAIVTVLGGRRTRRVADEISAHLATIKTNEATIGGLRLLVEELRQEKAALKADYEDEKEQQESLQSRITEIDNDRTALMDRISNLRNVRFFHHWPFLPSDPAPRDPLCPICFGKNAVTHLIRHEYGYFGPKATPGEFDIDLVCEQCSKRVTINRNIRDGLLEILAKEFKPPWAS